MPKKSPAKREKVDIQEILKNPTSKRKLQAYIDEAVRMRIETLRKREEAKMLKDDVINELGISGKLFDSLVGVFFNNNFDEKKAELEQLETAIELMQVALPDNSSPKLEAPKEQEDEEDEVPA